MKVWEAARFTKVTHTNTCEWNIQCRKLKSPLLVSKKLSHVHVCALIVSKCPPSHAWKSLDTILKSTTTNCNDKPLKFSPTLQAPLHTYVHVHVHTTHTTPPPHPTPVSPVKNVRQICYEHMWVTHHVLWISWIRGVPWRVVAATVGPAIHLTNSSRCRHLHVHVHVQCHAYIQIARVIVKLMYVDERKEKESETHTLIRMPFVPLDNTYMYGISLYIKNCTYGPVFGTKGHLVWQAQKKIQFILVPEPISWHAQSNHVTQHLLCMSKAFDWGSIPCTAIKDD